MSFRGLHFGSRSCVPSAGANNIRDAAFRSVDSGQPCVRGIRLYSDMTTALNSEEEPAFQRQESRCGPLRRDDLNPDPVAQFRSWFQQAECEGVIEPNAMTLCTVGTPGAPTCRTVLLKAFDHRGFVFFTNLQSRKAEQISRNPGVSALFPWLAMARQVEIRGAARLISKADAVAYFLSRPIGSRLGAWVSRQSRVIPSRSVLQIGFDQMKQRFRDGKIPMPDDWGGFRIDPVEFEFWQGGQNRLHDRFRYTLSAPSGWLIERLAP